MSSLRSFRTHQPLLLLSAEQSNSCDPVGPQEVHVTCLRPPQCWRVVISLVFCPCCDLMTLEERGGGLMLVCVCVCVYVYFQVIF